MKYLIPLSLILLSACGPAPSSSSGDSGINGTSGQNGANGTNGTNGLSVTSVTTCQATNTTYKVGTQIDLFYQEVIFSDNKKFVSCTIHTTADYSTHSEYLATASSKNATGECDVNLDVNDFSGGYWKFTRDKKLIYNDSNSAVAGTIYDFSSFCN